MTNFWSDPFWIESSNTPTACLSPECHRPLPHCGHRLNACARGRVCSPSTCSPGSGSCSDIRAYMRCAQACSSRLMKGWLFCRFNSLRRHHHSWLFWHLTAPGHPGDARWSPWTLRTGVTMDKKDRWMQVGSGMRDRIWKWEEVSFAVLRPPCRCIVSCNLWFQSEEVVVLPSFVFYLGATHSLPSMI